MRQDTIIKLNQLNTDFYERVGPAFSDSRSTAWEGWEQLLDVLTFGHQEIQVLDVGCGNGRFFGFLRDHFPTHKINYIGIDSSEFLLSTARHTYPDTTAQFLSIDLVTQPELVATLPQDFDLIIAFGVFHHIPSLAGRRALHTALLSHLKSGGKYVFTIWHFITDTRLMQRQIPWTAVPHIDHTDIEEGDMLLDWRRDTTAIRYCHYSSEQEVEATLQQRANLQPIKHYKADGAHHESNHYYIYTIT